MSNKKKKQPETSREAYKSLQPEQLRDTYKKIIEALKVLGLASTEQIAKHLTLEHAKVHKRTSEMERLEMIYRPGTKVLTKSNRLAFQWAICGKNHPKTTAEKSQKALKGKPSVVDFSKKLIQKPTQSDLFTGK